MIKGGYIPVRGRQPTVGKKRPVAKRRRVAGRKRPLGKTAVVQKRVKRQRVYKDDDSGGDMAMRKVAGGRKMPRNIKGVWRVLDANTQSNVYYFSYVNRFMTPANASAVPGYINCGSQWSGTSVGSGTFCMPLVLVSLSNAPNVNQGSVGKPSAFYVANRTSATGNIGFSYYGQWDVHNVAGTSAGVQSFPGQVDLLRAINAKMVLYGTLTRPTKFRIDVVQIMEPYLHPDYIISNTTNTEQQAATAFYDELTREYTYSPATFSNQNATKRKIKYLKSWTHLIQPRNTSEAAVQENYSGTTEVTTNLPHSHVFNIYERFGRRQKYNWDDNITTSEPTGNANDNIAIDAGVNRLDVTYRARIYLMVRALAPSPNINGTWEPTITPSFDLSCRSYHTNLG